MGSRHRQADVRSRATAGSAKTEEAKLKAVGEGTVDGAFPSVLSPDTRMRIELEGVIGAVVPVILSTWLGVVQMAWASAALEDFDGIAGRSVA